MYKIKNLVTLEFELKTSMQKHFVDFFHLATTKEPAN